MKNIFKSLKEYFNKKFFAIRPGKNASRGAALVLLSFTIIIWILLVVGSVVSIGDPWALTLYLTSFIVALLSSYLIIYLLKLINDIPKFYRRILFLSIPLLFVVFSFCWYCIIYFIVIFSLLGASLWVIIKTKLKNIKLASRIITLLGFVIGVSGITAMIIAYIPSGFEVEPVENAALKSQKIVKQISVSSPGDSGNYKVITLTYGSGKDKHRPEYGNDADIITDSVNGLPFIDNWRGIGGWIRSKYWGFDIRSLPLNARVWYPDGEGPFPLVLVVHGNHFMRDYSDPGYDYLGELLASRGFILASVDENFINGAWSDAVGWLKNENDARAWLLLEHLKQWHKWNRTEGNVFHNKIDTNNIALIGHSRGGESVAHAAFFNKLPFYPDDALVKFDYNFNIKSIVAIAPCDAQYKPGKCKTPLENISYLVIHGAQDADVSSYMGYQQFERLNFTDTNYHFKAGVYIYGANHGQFNSTWGNNDIAHPFTGLLNLKQLMTEKDQQQIAKVYISAFLEATLKEKNIFLPLFADARTGKEWLPETIYLNQFEDSRTKIVCSFDEDFDLASRGMKKNAVYGENLTVWREQLVEFKWGNTGNKAVFLGWNDNDSLIASYSFELDSSDIDTSLYSVFCFTMADTDLDCDPRSKGKWIRGEDKQDKPDEKTKDKKEDKKKPLDFTIRWEDGAGQTIEFPISMFSYLQPKIDTKLMKTDFIKNEGEKDIIFQIFMFPVREVLKLNPQFQYKDISKISFIFDRTKNGVVAIDKIGFMEDLKAI